MFAVKISRRDFLKLAFVGSALITFKSKLNVLGMIARHSARIKATNWQLFLSVRTLNVAVGSSEKCTLSVSTPFFVNLRYTLLILSQQKRVALDFLPKVQVSKLYYLLFHLLFSSFFFY